MPPTISTTEQTDGQADNSIRRHDADLLQTTPRGIDKLDFVSADLTDDEQATVRTILGGRPAAGTGGLVTYLPQAA